VEGRGKNYFVGLGIGRQWNYTICFPFPLYGACSRASVDISTAKKIWILYNWTHPS